MTEKKRPTIRSKAPAPPVADAGKTAPGKKPPAVRTAKATKAPKALPVQRAPRSAAAKRTRATPAPESSASEAPQSLSVLMITPEAHPFATTDGLADETGTLPHALARLGHRVTLVLPRYRGVDVADARGDRMTLQFGDRVQDVSVYERQWAEGVTIVFVDAPELFDRSELYGEAGHDYADNSWRFAVFSRAALEYARRRRERPSVIHAYDWQTGLVPVFQKMQFSDDPAIGGVPVVFTIHDLAYQGVFPSSILPEIGLGWEVFDVQALEYWGQISYLKGGINFSERITTASSSDAREILTPERGFGLDGVLSRRADALTGIVSGNSHPGPAREDSWDVSAREYVKVYRNAAEAAPKAGAGA